MLDSANFPNAYKEVYTILKYVKSEDLKLIPKEFMDMIQINMNRDYEFNYDETLDFEEQNLLRETKAIFAYMFLHFWGNEKQKDFIKTLIREDRKKLEEEKKKNSISTAEMFENLRSKPAANVEEKLLMDEYSSNNRIKSFFEKVRLWIKKLLNK